MANTMEEVLSEVIDYLNGGSLKGKDNGEIISFGNLVSDYAADVLEGLFFEEGVAEFRDGRIYLDEDYRDRLDDIVDRVIDKRSNTLYQWLLDTEGFGFDYYLEQMGPVQIWSVSDLEGEIINSINFGVINLVIMAIEEAVQDGLIEIVGRFSDERYSQLPTA